MTIKSICVQFKTACELLDKSRESLRHIVRTDSTFPQQIKIGDTKQVYFNCAQGCSVAYRSKAKPCSVGGLTMNPSILNFNQYNVRFAFDANGEPLFCLADVCKALEMQRANLSCINLNPKGTHSLYILTIKFYLNMTFISEENLFRIIFQSTKPEALKFQKWVFTELLPTIRMTGSYLARQTAYEELKYLCMQEKVSKEKGTFHSLGLHRRKQEKHINAIRIEKCKSNLQLELEL